MVRPLLTIILPGIRVGNWGKLYESIFTSFSGSFELIIVGPHKLPRELRNEQKIIFHQDWGNPVRCQQIAAEKAKGKYITWASDDGVFMSNMLTEAIEHLELMNNKKNIVVFNYLESNNMVSEKSLRLVNAYPRTNYINSEWMIFNVAVLYTEYFRELGGFDCSFEGTAVGHADLACRAQRDEALVRIINKPMLNCSWMPGMTGDHRTNSLCSDRTR